MVTYHAPRTTDRVEPHSEFRVPNRRTEVSDGSDPIPDSGG